MPLKEVINGNKDIDRPVRWSRDRLARIEDLELALDAAVHVNRHLNREIEGLIQQIDRERQQRQAWEEQAKRLAQQLAQHKRAAGVVPMDISRQALCCNAACQGICSSCLYEADGSCSYGIAAQLQYKC